MWLVVYFCVVCRSGWKNNACESFDTMISIRQRKGIQTTEVSEDYTAQEENAKLEDKLPSSM